MKMLRFFKHLYVQVLLAILVGVIFGHYEAALAVKFKPLADGFIALVKMLIPPVIFLAIVSGILSVNQVSKAGKVGGFAFLYFMLMTTFALIVGVLVSHFLQPGSGFTVDISTLNTASISAYVDSTKQQDGVIPFLLHIIPKTFVSAFAEGNILQILLLALLFAFALTLLKDDKKTLIGPINSLTNVFFKMMDYVLKLAPIGAFAAIAFSVGHFGLAVLGQLFFLLACFYVTCTVFIFVVLGLVLKLSCGISIMQLLRYLREELVIVLATSSSESVLARLINKLEALGAHPDVVRLVVPTGYSFNLDGTAIYLTMAALFIAQATQVELNFHQILVLLGLMIITSKGAATVSGGGFITLAATLTAFQIIPVEGIVLILGIDRFLSEGRAITNVIGNSVAALFIAQRMGELDKKVMLAAVEK
jgi:aerobic C4-dicarboxylate transport protein